MATVLNLTDVELLRQLSVLMSTAKAGNLITSAQLRGHYVSAEHRLRIDASYDAYSDTFIYLLTQA